MASNILIGIGGSGQHVVHAYLRLLALTSPKPGDVPHVFLIDADAKEGAAEGKQSTLVEDAVKLHAYLVAGHTSPSRFGLIRPFHVDEQQGRAPALLGELLEIHGDANPDRALAHAFLSDDPGEFGSDWEIEVAKGMMANPKVGALALGHKVTVEGRRSRHTDAKQMIERLIDAPLDDARIAIAGSSFGGTGSGVVPALVRQLDALPGNRRIRAYFTLPWFSLDRGPNAQRSAAQEQGGVDPTLRNASLGLHTYHGELSGAENAKYRLRQSSYVLAQSMRDWGESVRRASGDFDQPEHPHVLNLIVSCAIQGFFGIQANPLQSGSLYTLKTAEAEENVGRFSPDTSPHLRFHAGTDDNRQLRDLWADSEATAFVLDSCGQRLEEVQKGVLTIPKVGEQNGLSGLDQFLLELVRLLGQPRASYGLLPRRSTAPDSVFKDLGSELRKRARHLRQTLVWLDAHAPSNQAGANAPGLRGFAPRHLFSVEGHSPLGPTRTDTSSLSDEATLAANWGALGVDVRGAKDTPMAGAPVHSQAMAVLRSIQSNESADGRAGGLTRLDQLMQSFSAEEKLSAKETSGDKGNKSGPPTEMAARVLARAIFQRVFEMRNKSRLRAAAKDAQQHSLDVPNSAGRPMLKFDLAGTPIADSRHVQFRLDDHSMSGRPVDPMHPEHPLSLVYLDPYSGLSPDAGERISLAGHVFIEHGLKGIPNVIAPRLLQQWRLSRCAPPQPGITEELYTVQNRRVRSTRAGIYLHACRVIEAAFWVAVSSNRQVEWIDDIFTRAHDHSPSPFSALVRAEMGLGAATAGDGLPALVFSAKHPDAGKPIFVWDGETWFLAANRAAREFFSRLVPQLPSVRYRYRADNPLRMAQTPDETRLTGLDRYFARQVQSYCATLDERKRALNGQLEPSLRMLRAALDHIAAELPPPEGSAAVEEGGAIVLPLSGRATEPKHLEIRPPQALRKVLEHLCTPVVVFVNKDRQPNGMLPLKAEAWAWLEGGEGENLLVLDGAGISSKIDDRKLARAKIKEIRLKVRGIGEIREQWPFGNEPKDVIADELDWAFGIWPNFQAPAWNYYVVSGATRIGDPGEADLENKSPLKRVNVPWMNEKHAAELVVRGRPREGNASMSVLGTISAALPARIDGVPQVMELRVGGQVLGSRPIPLTGIRPGNQIMPLVGLDFGTSNSCMAIQTRDDDATSRHSVPLLPGGTLINEPAAALFFGLHSTGDEEEVRRFQAEAANFYYAMNLPAGAAAGTLPSELLVTLDAVEETAEKQKHLLANHYPRQAAALLDSPAQAPHPTIRYPLVSPLLTPLPPKPSSASGESGEFYAWLARMVSDMEERVFDNLKWPRPGDDDNYTKSRALRALYLEGLLIAALAALRKNGFGQFKAFVATLPEALAQLESRFADSYSKDLSSILIKLCQRTGMHWSPVSRAPNVPVVTDGELQLVSETTAALQSAGVGEEGLNSVMTIDIGGGTTDVGIDLRYPRHVSISGTPRRYTASARFAGNRLLEALVHVPQVRSLFEESQPYADSAVVSLLKAELRADELKAQNTTTAYVANVFFDAIYEYAFNALRNFLRINPDWLDLFLADKEREFRVILIGNGFKLYNACQTVGSSSSLDQYNDVIKERLVAAGVIDQRLARRIKFRVQDDSKASLIRVGALDAAQSGETLSIKKLQDRFVLLPEALQVIDPEGIVESGFSWLKAETFEKMVEQRHQFVMDHSTEAMRVQFPLTYEHWLRSRPKDQLGATFENIFLSKGFGKYYRDPGAIYLSGVPASRSESIVKLMIDLAQKGA